MKVNTFLVLRADNCKNKNYYKLIKNVCIQGARKGRRSGPSSASFTDQKP